MCATNQSRLAHFLHTFNMRRYNGTLQMLLALTALVTAGHFSKKLRCCSGQGFFCYTADTLEDCTMENSKGNPVCTRIKII